MSNNRFGRQAVPQALCLGAFIALEVAAVAQDNARDGFATALAVLGVAVFLAGIFLPRLLELEVTPKSLKLKLSERDATAELANEDRPTLEAAAERLDEPDIVPVARMLLAWQALGQLLGDKTDGPLAGAVLELYLYDVDEDALVPIRAPDDGETDGHRWRVGTGATGTAYERGEYVLVEGASVSDDTYGLTEEEQARYEELTGVAAMPVVNAGGQVIGVLTASSLRPEPFLGSTEAFEEQLAVSYLIARVLIDVLHWFEERYDS